MQLSLQRAGAQPLGFTPTVTMQPSGGAPCSTRAGEACLLDLAIAWGSVVPAHDDMYAHSSWLVHRLKALDAMCYDYRRSPRAVLGFAGLSIA